MEYYPSITKNGTLYFGRNDSGLTRGDIYLSRLIENKYSNSKKLPEVVNLPGTSFNAFIASDESFLIFSIYIEDNSSGTVIYTLLLQIAMENGLFLKIWENK